MTWDEIKKKRQKNTPGTSTLPWDEIKRSRGYTAPLEPEPIVMRSRPMQSSQEVIDRVKRDTGIQMPVPARTAAPSPTPSQIPTPTPTPPPTPTPTPTAAPAPTQYDGPLLKAYKPTGLQKVRDFFRKAGDKSKSAAYGVAEGLNSNALERLVENVLFRWNKQANNQLPKGWNAVGDVEREYKTLEPELKSQGYTAEQIKESKKAALDLARIQDDEKAYKAWMDKGPAWEPDKSDKIARTAGEIGGRVTGALYVSKILAPFVGAAGLPKGISDIIQGIGTGVITGATGAYGAGGDVGDVATAAGRNALFMAAGGLTSQAIGTGGSSLLSKMPALKNTIGADIGLNVLKGIGFGAAGTAATLPTYPKDQRPAGDEVIKNALVYGLFEGISSTMSTIAKAAQNKAAMNNAMRLFETDIKGKYNNARSIAGRNPAEALKLYASLLDDIDASTQALKQNRYVGAKDQVNKAIELMGKLKTYVQNEMDMVGVVAKSGAPGRYIGSSVPTKSSTPSQSSPLPTLIPSPEIPLIAQVDTVKPTTKGADLNDAKHKAKPETKEVEPVYKSRVYQGQGKSGEQIYTQVKYPILGRGSYFANDEKTAKNYGNNVTEREVSLNNPIIIRDDAEWRKLTREAGWEYPNPLHSGTEEKIISDIDKLKDVIISKGHDGVVVDFEKFKIGDTNRLTGNSIKTISNLFSHDQVVVYDKRYAETPRAQEKQKLVTTGSTVKAYDNDNNEYEFNYAVLSADDLIASHDTNLDINRAYPQELQPRDRTRVSSKTQIEKIAGNIQPELLGDNPKISDGAPIIGHDNIVESGNGRVIALKKMYQKGDYENYQTWLKNNAEKYGLDPNNLPENPVLVRVRNTDVDRTDFVKKANETSVALMSATETAKSDAERLSGRILELFAANENGIINTADNRPFISAFTGEVIPSNEIGRYVTPEGYLSQEGLQRVRNAIFYKAYGSDRLLTRISESTDNNIKNITNSLINTAPRIVSIKDGIQKNIHYPIDYANDITAAVEKYINLKESNTTVEEYLQQLTFFNDGVSPSTKLIMSVLDDNSRSAKKITEFFNTVFDSVEELGDPNQQFLFGERTNISKEEVLNNAYRRFRDAGQQEFGSTIESRSGKSEEIERIFRSKAGQTRTAAETKRAAKTGAAGQVKTSSMAIPEDPNAPMPVPKRTEKILPWPDNFPELVNMTNLTALKNPKSGNLELHRRAKAGDEEAAAELVLRVSKTPLIQELGRRFPNAMVAYVHAEESTGINQLPNAYARLIGKIAGLEIAETLIQINRAQRTSKSSGERLFQPVYFDGPVIAGQEYILVDDVITQGGTIRGLREYIESNGGKVVAVSTLAMGRGKSPKTIAIKKETVQALYKKFGRVNINTALKEEGIANEATELTHAEGTYILHNFQHVDEIRSGSPEKRRNRIGQTDGRDSGTQDEGKRPDQVSDTQSYAPQAQAASIPESSGTSERSKTVDDIVQIIEKHTGVPIRTGRFRQRAYGIYKNQSGVIRTRVTNNLPVIAHELGHHFDRLYGFSKTSKFDSELSRLGAVTSRSSYSKKQVRMEGIAEFVRLYLTSPDGLSQKAPKFLKHVESKLDKETLDFLGQLRDEISQYANLPYNKRIYADISRGESRKSTNRKEENIFHKFYDAWINDKGPFKRIQKAADEAGYKGLNIETSVKVYSGLEAKVENMFTDKQLDLNNKVVGPSLGEILEPINIKEIKNRDGNPKQEHEDFISYLVSRRAADYETRELNMPQPYFVYQSNIKAMEKKYPHFDEVFKGLRKWEDNNFKLLVDSEIMSAKDAAEIRKNNPNHMPLHRIQEAVEVHRAGSGRTLGQSKKVIKKATGSGKTIIDPLESIIADTFIIRRAAESNAIMLDLKKVVESIEASGDIMEALPPGLKMTQFTAAEIRKQLKDMAVVSENNELLKALDGMSDDELETALRVFRPLYSERNGEITIYEKGKPRLYYVEPELYKAIKGLNRQQSHFIIRLLNIPKRVLQAGAVTTVDFVMRNMGRDTSTSLIQSETGLTPLDIFKGYLSALRKDKHYYDFIRHGGGTEFFNLSSRTTAQMKEDELLGYDIGFLFKRAIDDAKEMTLNNNERTRNRAKNSMQAILRIPFKTLQDAVNWSELGPRVAEHRKAIDKNIDQKTATVWGRALSVDFTQAGYYGREVNKIKAFFNAFIQGNVRIYESFKNHPYRTILRGLLYVTLPTLVNYFINTSDDERKEAYQQLPEWRKALAWNIWIGNGKFIPVPKPYGYAWIFGSVPEVFVEKLRTDNPDAWADLMEQFAVNFDFDPRRPIDSIVDTFMPSGMSPIVDIEANRTWTGAPIESIADEQEFDYLRYTANTSSLSKALGKWAKDVGVDISPKKVDHLVRAYTGSVGDFFWRLPDLGKDLAVDPTDVSQYPVVKKFVVDTAYSNQSMDKFYTSGTEITKYVNEMKKGIGRAVKNLSDEELAEAVTLIEQYQDIHSALTKQFSEGRKTIRELENMDLSVQRKKEAERAIRQGMNSVAYDFYQSYLNFKKKYKLK